MTDRNEELFLAVAAVIEEKPNRYRQDVWYARRDRCGTTACIAGWAAAIAIKNGDVNRARKAWDDPTSEDFFDPQDVAGKALGLTDDEREKLFDGSWKPHDGLSVPDALRKIGEGAEIEDVSA